MKKLTRERVVPIISARVSWVTGGISCSGSPDPPRIPTGIGEVDRGVIDAGNGLGMTRGELLRRVADERRSLVIEKRGAPKAVLLSIRDYVRLAAPEPEVLRLIGDESRRRGTNRLNSRQIDRVIQATRALKPKRR